MIRAIYGAIALVAGMRLCNLRIFSLVLLLLATAKLTLVDLFAPGIFYRIIGFTTLDLRLCTVPQSA